MIAWLCALFVAAVLVVVSVKTARRPVNFKPPTDADRLAAWEERLGKWRAEERRRAARGRNLFNAGADDMLDAAHYLTGVELQMQKIAAVRKAIAQRNKNRKPKLSLVPDTRQRAARNSDNAA